MSIKMTNFIPILTIKVKMMSMKKLLILPICLLIIGLVCSCAGTASSPADASVDTVTVAVVKLADTTSFKKSNGDVCSIYSDATFNYPTAFVDKPSLERLQRLYATEVLGAPDSLSLADAMLWCVANSLHQYDFSSSSSANEDEMDTDGTEPVTVYNTSNTVQMHYNRNGLVTFCRVEVVKKDSMVTSVTHRYCTIDLTKMAVVELADVFRDDAMNELTWLLRARLLDQNKVETSEQLNELGYYNVDNLVATNNFYFDENGMTWSYMPNELAVSAVGEPSITLTKDQLMPIASEASPLKRIF